MQLMSLRASASARSRDVEAELAVQTEAADAASGSAPGEKLLAEEVLRLVEVRRIARRRRP